MRRVGPYGLLLASLTAACGGSTPPAIACSSSSGTVEVGDTVAVQVALGARPRGGHADVLVRVDPLDEPGALRFESTPPPGAAAVALAVTPDAVFHGCVDRSPDTFRLVVSEAPHGRLWLRISSGRPVTVYAPTILGPAAGGGAGGAVTVLPGGSGRARWPVGAEDGALE